MRPLQIELHGSRHCMASSAIHSRPQVRPKAVRNAQNRGPARARTVTVSENPRRTLPQARTSPGHFRLRISISCPVRALAGPRKYTFYTARGPRIKVGRVLVRPTLLSRRRTGDDGRCAISVFLQSRRREATFTP